MNGTSDSRNARSHRADPAASVLPLPGSARLPVIVPAAVAGFFLVAVLDYALPLYFSAVNNVRSGYYPENMWSQVVKYQIIPFCFGPVLSGLLSRRFGERTVWSLALLGKFIISPLMMLQPSASMVCVLALWQGFTGALVWIAGVSLAQMVPPEKKGRANACMLGALGLGSLLGPILGRLIVYRPELASLCSRGEFHESARRLLNLSPMQSSPGVADFQGIFVLVGLATLASGLAIGLYGQYPGAFDQDAAPNWQQTMTDLRRLLRTPKFWMLVMTLCVLGGPLVQASNQFLPYRAEVLGLKSGAQDEGWIWLSLVKTLMWLPGGWAVGLLAGRRASGLVGVGILAAFSAAALGIGLADASGQLFLAVAVYEFFRQFIRWAYTGYLSEHMPSHLRSTAIGLSVTMAGFSSTIYCWVADAWWTPGSPAARPYAMPFIAAVVLGMLAAVILFLLDRRWPIRSPETVR